MIPVDRIRICIRQVLLADGGGGWGMWSCLSLGWEDEGCCHSRDWGEPLGYAGDEGM